MVVKKGNRGNECSKQFTSNNTAGIEALKPEFGMANPFGQKSEDCKDTDAGDTNCTYIQDFFCSNLTKVDFLEHCVISYDLKDNLMIRDLSNTLHVDPQVKWGPPKLYLLKDFAKIPLSIVIENQAEINMYCSKNDQQSSN